MRSFLAALLLLSFCIPALCQDNTRTFTYTKTPQADLDIVVHYPAGWKETDKRPGIVFFFGGGWENGTIKTFEPQAQYLASRGMVTARADYRVKSRHGVTPRECVDDARSAIRWFRQNAVNLGVDPDRIVASGGSAGGHIAACTTLMPASQRNDAKVSCQANALLLFNPVLRFGPQMLKRVDNNPAVGKAISPVLYLAKDSPPALLFFGTDDFLFKHGEEFMARSKELGHRAEMFIAEKQPHGFFNKSPWKEKTLQRADEFLVSLGYLQGKPTIQVPDGKEKTQKVPPKPKLTHLVGVGTHFAAAQPSTRPRVLVLTDISNEPDDEMTLIRFLVYANEFDIEGLIATTSTHLKNKVRPDIIRRTVETYGEVQTNLAKHRPGFPPAKDLLKKVAAGLPEYGMKGVGEGKMSEGAERLIAAADREDTRPLWIVVWGGPNTLAQALWQVRNTRSKEQVEAFVNRLRVYTISDQDDSGPWLRREFPNLFYIVSPGPAPYHRATWTGISGDRFYKNCTGADFTTVSQVWLDTHIRSKGPLGALYPKVAYIMEGDTPSFMNLISNGLEAHENPGWGGWGGRYELRKSEGEIRPIWANSQDTVIGSDGKTHTSDQATIWRWRTAFQHDFAARMDWTVQEVTKANHNPTVVVNGQAGKKVVRLKARVGQPLKLSAAGTTDSDGNKLTYRWFVYPEAGRYRGTITIAQEQAMETTVNIEKSSQATPGTAHIILAVEDDGVPRLTSYRRVILEVEPTE